MKLNKFYEWMEVTNQNFLDPTEYNETSKYCEVCDIEENKTYFIDETSICQDCYKKLPEPETNENN